MKTSSAALRTSPGAYWMLAVVTLLYVVSMIDRQIIGLLVPHIKAQFGVSDIQVSFATGAAFAISYSLAGLPVGYAVDQMSRRIVLFIGVLVWGLATMVCGLAASFAILVVARIMVGVGQAVLSPAAYSLFGDRFPNHKLGRVMAVFGIGATFGTVISYGLGGQLMAALPAEGLASPFGLLRPWQGTFVIAALPALLALPLIFTFAEPRVTVKRVSGPRFAGGLAAAFRQKAFFGPYFLANGMLLMGSWAFSMWIPTVYMRRLGLSVLQAGTTLSVVSAVSVVSGALFFGMFTDYLAKRGHTDSPMRSHMLAGIGFAVAGLGLLLTHSFGWTVFFTGLMFVCCGFPALASAIPMTAAPNVRGQVSALYLLVGNVFGLGMGPSVVALFTDYVYRDENLLHVSLATTLLITGPVAALLLFVAQAPMRRAVAAVGAEARAHEDAATDADLAGATA